MCNQQRTTAEGKEKGRYSCGGATSMFSCLSRAFGASEAAQEHFRQSGIEFMKGMRKILDEQMQGCERPKAKPIIL